jgi:hypothetical protein
MNFILQAFNSHNPVDYLGEELDSGHPPLDPAHRLRQAQRGNSGLEVDR